MMNNGLRYRRWAVLSRSVQRLKEAGLSEGLLNALIHGSPALGATVDCQSILRLQWEMRHILEGKV